MKSLGYLAIFLLSGAGVFLGMSRRQHTADWNSTTGTMNSVKDDRSWDEKNRRPTNSAFFIDKPNWMGGARNSTSGRPKASSQPVSSGVQSNPFSD